MKTKTLFAAVLLSCFVSSQAQDLDSKKNIIKTNLTAYAFRNYNLTYERSLLKWLSLSVSYGQIPEGKIPFSSQFFDTEEEPEFDVNSAQLSNTQFTIESRFYLGKGYGRGFYFAPYYRQTKIKMSDVVYNMYFDAIDDDVPVTFSGNITGNGFGLMLGSQWALGKNKNWVIDFWIVGGHYGTGDGNFDGITDRILTPQEQAQLQESLEDIDLSGSDFETTITTNARGVNMVLTGPWAGLRSGLSLGYRF